MMPPVPLETVGKVLRKIAHHAEISRPSPPNHWYLKVGI